MHWVSGIVNHDKSHILQMIASWESLYKDLFITRLQLPNNDLRNKNTSWWIGDWFDKQGEISEVWGRLWMHLFWMFWVQPMFYVHLGGFSLFPKSTTASTSMSCFFACATKNNQNTLGLAGFSKFRPPQPSAGESENPNPWKWNAWRW